MKKTNKILSVFLAVVMLFSAMSVSLCASAFTADPNGLWADPADGITQTTVTSGTNTANTVNAGVLLDFLDSVLADVKIEGDVADVIKAVNAIGITVNINSVDGILGTIDSVATLNSGFFTSTAVRVAFGYGLVTKNWTKDQTRAKTGDVAVLSNLIGFLADNQEFLGAFVANKTNIVNISTVLKKDLGTYLKEALAKLIYDYEKDPSLQGKYDAAKVKSLDDIILQDGLGYGLNGLLKQGDDMLKDLDNKVVNSLYGYGFKLEGLLDGYNYNPKYNLDETIAQIADIIWNKNKEYVKDMLVEYGAELQEDITSSEYGAPFAKLIKFDKFSATSDFSFLNFTNPTKSNIAPSVKGINNFVGQLISAYTTYKNWDNTNKNLGGNIEAFFKWAIDNRDKTIENSPYEAYDFSGDTTKYALALAKMIVDSVVADEDVKATLKDCSTTQEVIVKLVPVLVKDNEQIVINSKSTTWEKVLGDILGSYLDDYAILYTDTKNTKRYVKGSGTDVWKVLNYALNYYLVDLNLDTLFGLSLTKSEDVFSKLDKLQAVLFGTMAYSKASQLINPVLDAIFNLDLNTAVKIGVEDAFVNINKSVTAANLAYNFINNILGAVVGQVVFTGSFTTLENIVSNNSLEKAVKKLLAGLNTRKGELLPVILFIFSALDSESQLEVKGGTDGTATVTYGGRKLTKGKDYKITLATGNKATVTGIGNYAGSYTFTSKCKNHVYGEFTVTKKATCSAKGSQYRVCQLCGNKDTQSIATVAHKSDAGTATKKATAKADGTLTYKCTVCKKVMKTATINKVTSFKLSKTEMVYTGKALKPTVTVKDSKNKALKLNTDYTVKYANNTKVGQATVTVTLKGKYSGTKTLKFNIVPTATTMSKVTAASKGFTATWKKQATQTTGYEVQYSTSSKFTSSTTKTVTVKKNSTVSQKVTKLKASTKYYVRVRTYTTAKVDGKSTKLYSAWSKSMTVTTKK